MERYAVDADIAVARTLPGRFYRDPAVWAAQRDTLFPRTWHLFPDGVAPTAAEQVPWTLLPGVLDEPLMLLGDGPRCLSNVCTHRGAVIVTERQRSRTLRCPYHGRRFSSDGRCLSAPGFEGCEGFPSARDHLPEVPVAALGGAALLRAQIALAGGGRGVRASAYERGARRHLEEAVRSFDRAQTQMHALAARRLLAQLGRGDRDRVDRRIRALGVAVPERWSLLYVVGR